MMNAIEGPLLARAFRFCFVVFGRRSLNVLAAISFHVRTFLSESNRENGIFDPRLGPVQQNIGIERAE